MSERTYLKVSRRIVAPLLFAYIIAYVDRVNVGFAKLQMLQALHFSETTYGLGAGMFFVGYFLFGVPGTLALHRIGARRWLGGLMIVWGMISCAMAFVGTPLQFYTLRVLLGLAEAGFFPGVIFYLTQWFPADRRARATALLMTAIAICGALGSPLSGWIMQTFDAYLGWAGWRWLFVLEALPAVLMGVYLFLRLEDSLAESPWLSHAEKLGLSTALAQDVVGKPHGSFSAAIRDRHVWLLCAIYFCVVTGLYGLSFWLPTIISEMGIQKPIHIGVISAIPYTVGGIGMLLVGHCADLRKEYRRHIAAPAATGALALIISATIPDYRVAAMVALAVAAWGILSAPPMVWSIATAHLRGAAAAGGIGLVNSFGNLAGFASPYAVGWMRDLTGSTASGMFVVAACVLSGAFLAIVGLPPQQRS